jgi:alanine dehydrogenase
MKIGIIREGKTPPDSRVPLTPHQCKTIHEKFNIPLIVEPSPRRCYKDEEYQKKGIELSSDMASCDLLLGIKEVPVDQLIPKKTYCFFSHTIKEQAYNRKLLQSILQKKIRLIDYEVLTNEKGRRLIAFGRFAGMVGAHNAVYAYGKRTGLFGLKRMKDHHDYAEAIETYKSMRFPPFRIVLTGTGRVGSGAAQVLTDMGIRQVEPEDFLKHQYNEAVFTQLRLGYYVGRVNGKAFPPKEFYEHPDRFVSIFEPYTKVSDVMINGIYWDKRAPAFFSRQDMCAEDFRIRVIADVTCDIAPISSIPSTLRASSIQDPIFGYNPFTGSETEPQQEHAIDMMTVDNLPSELPRDSSKAFGNQFIDHIIPEFLKPQSDMIDRATVAINGELGERFKYLKRYVEG